MDTTIDDQLGQCDARYFAADRIKAGYGDRLRSIVDQQVDSGGILDGADGAQVGAADLAAPILVISQFTLYANTDKGRRPSWHAAAPAAVAEPVVAAAAAHLRTLGATVATGRFGAHMAVELVNDGPVTILLEV